MDKNFKPISSVGYSNYEVIKNIMTLYKIEQFDLDCTFSTGAFWKNLPGPKIKSDLRPLFDDVIEANSENLPFNDNSMNSIMYDPPFTICGKTYLENKDGSSVIAKRFHGYERYEDLKSNYYKTLKELYRVCNNGGFVVFKNQDSVSGGLNYFTHAMIINMANEIGFYVKDMFVLISKIRINSFGGRWKKQEHARKYHCYYIILQKVKNRINYNFKQLGSEEHQDIPYPQSSNSLQYSPEIQ